MNQLRSTAEARQLLNDPTQPSAAREAAVRFLGGDPTPANLERLIQALEDNDFGVRWTAAATLARLGDVALTPLLRTLVQKHISVWLREGALHILYYNQSYQVSQRTAELQQMLKGPAAEVAAAAAAARLLQQLQVV